MDTYITLINVILTCISIGCAIFSLKQTRKQTRIMEEQLDESKKPNFPFTSRLTSIANALDSINETLKAK